VPEISANTRAALLLTSPLHIRKGDSNDRLLTPAEYGRLAQFLHERGAQPADLLKSNAGKLVRACEEALGGTEIEPLLGREFRLDRAAAHWKSRSIWVYGHLDAEYPSRVKERLGRTVPPVLFGCGQLPLPADRALAFAGSIDASPLERDFAIAYAGLAAEAGVTVLSGGSWGAEQIAMRAALDAGGVVVAVLTEGLRRVALAEYHRTPLREGKLVLLSPFDPLAGFVARNAVARTRVLYALADTAVVVSAAYKKDVAWAGAAALLKERDHIPLYVRAPDPNALGLAGLIERGASVWPGPDSPAGLRDLLDNPVSDRAEDLERARWN
jgi:predicted Rossmann fold nucleotide-binding protein DprA/Smf involved in DNA uptake